jgi:hypothetical protein
VDPLYPFDDPASELTSDTGPFRERSVFLTHGIVPVHEVAKGADHDIAALQKNMLAAVDVGNRRRRTDYSSTPGKKVRPPISPLTIPHCRT